MSNVQEFLYTVWLRDHFLEIDDQDYEWPSCLLIVADSEEEARSWGDQLSRKLCEKDLRIEFLYSLIGLPEGDLTMVPRIRVGEKPSVDIIG
jgi:hypothetical protein